MGDDADDRDRVAKFRRLVELEKECAELRGELGVFEPLAEAVPSRSEGDPAIYALIANAASDFVSVHGADGRYVYASPACERLFGWTPPELAGRSAYDFFHPDDIERIAADHESHADLHALHSIEYRLRRRDGSYAWVETHSRAYRTDAGVDRIVCITHDISRRRDLQDQKEKLIEELEKRISQIRTLSGFLPICAWCKSVRDDAGYWQQVEAYLANATEMEITHSICPACRERLDGTRE